MVKVDPPVEEAASPVDPGDPRLESGEAWSALCDTLKASAERVLGEGVPATPRDRAEGFRYLTRFLAAGIASCVTNDDPDHPLFTRMIDYSAPWGLDNPDCLYLYAPLRGDAEYRVTGMRGSAHHIDFQVNAGHYSLGSVQAVTTIGSLDGFALETDADGRFELLLSAERQAGNWLEVAPGAEFLLVRQYFDDWEKERPADLQIERVGARYPLPAPRSAWVADHLEKLSRWIEQGGALWEKMSRGFLSAEPNSLIIHQADAASVHSGMRGLVYGVGNFHCEPGEAVLLEFTPPACHHWGVSVANWYWEAVEYATHQSSLNGHQATLDRDGVFRAVIAHEDPGVPNWLDPAGNPKGTLTARFLDAGSVPEIGLRRLPFGELRAALPADSSRIDAAERAASLARRRRAVLGRFRS
ncbi:MAG: DUF1214 domain-containing protein [Deltaproteobacteria bacterium]|nr:DUF1214 domain-containing protein [Deltaproteobacteria bacterium]